MGQSAFKQCIRRSRRRQLRGTPARAQLLLVALVMVLPGRALTAQETNGYAAGVPSNFHQQVDRQSQIEANLIKLIETTGRVREQLAHPLPSTMSPTPQAERTPAMRELELPSALEAWQPNANPSSSEAEIRERIKLLRRLRNRSVNDPSETPSSLADAVAQPRPTDWEPAQQPRENDPSLLAIDRNIDHEQQPVVPTETVVEAPIETTELVSSPVNALACGQSLYRTKNYASALKALESADVASLDDSDRTWLELLMALCQRRLGQTDAAEARLREISNANSNDYPVSIARWWLKQTELIRDARPILSQVSAELDTLIERSKTHVQH